MKNTHESCAGIGALTNEWRLTCLAYQMNAQCEPFNRKASMNKLHSVQYLRAVAALLVVVAHAFSLQIGVDNHYVVLAGRLGVVLFFVISGFIMVYISGTGPFSALDFLKRRAIRIVPLYWLFTSLAALLAAAAPSLFQTTIFTWPHFLKSLFFIVHEAPARGDASPLLSLGWTLNYEAYFYVTFAMLALAMASTRIVTLTIFYIATWLLGMLVESSDPVLKFYLNMSPLAFAVGTWIGWAALAGKLTRENIKPGLMAATAVAGLALTFIDETRPLMAALNFAGQVLWGASILILGLTFETGIKYRRWLEQLGNASYAIYLSHIFVIGAVVVVVRKLAGTNGPTTVAFAAVISAIAATFVGVIVHELVEKPILRVLNDRRKKHVGTRAPRNASAE